MFWKLFAFDIGKDLSLSILLVLPNSLYSYFRIFKLRLQYDKKIHNLLYAFLLSFENFYDSNSSNVIDGLQLFRISVKFRQKMFKVFVSLGFFDNSMVFLTILH